MVGYSFGLPKPKARGQGTQLLPKPVAPEPDWERPDGLLMLPVGGQLEPIEVDPEHGPLVYTSSGETRPFELKNMTSNSALEVPQKQWKA